MSERDDSTEPTRSDVRLIGQAVRERWPIPPEKREAIVNELILNALAGSPREQVMAAKVLESMDKINLEQEKRDLGLAQKVEIHHTGRIDFAQLTDAQLEDLIRDSSGI